MRSPTALLDSAKCKAVDILASEGFSRMPIAMRIAFLGYIENI